jgi:hypothetical protein
MGSLDVENLARLVSHAANRNGSVTGKSHAILAGDTSIYVPILLVPARERGYRVKIAATNRYHQPHPS